MKTKKNRNNRHFIGALAISFAAILWGVDGVVLTPRLFNLDVAFVVFMLHIVPFVLMNIFLFKEYKHLKDFSKEDYIYFGLIALFGGAVGTLAIVKALFLVNFQALSVVVLLQKLQPIFALILAWAILKERLREKFYILAGIAIAASYFLVFGWNIPNMNTGGDNVLAAAYSLLAALSFGSATVFGKKVLYKYSFKTGTFYRFFFTTILMSIYVVIFSGFGFSSMTTTNWLIILLITFTTGSGAIFLYYFGLNRIKASVSTICELFYPLTAILLDYLVNGVLLSWVQIIAAGVLIYVIVMINKKN
jgi:drug/metabolite transporter (DMT)-like permease